MESAPSPVSQAVLNHLARTRGWTLFICVLLWIGVAVMALSAVSTFFMFQFGEASESFRAAGAMGAMSMMITFLPIFYLAYAGLLVYPALKLGKYASRIGALLIAPNEEQLAAALDQQRGFWKSIGIAVIISIGLYVGIIAIAMLGAFRSGLSSL